MRFNIDKGRFSNALSTISGIIEKRNTIPILSHVHMTASNGQLILVGTDLDIQVSITLPADISEPGEVAVDAHTLAQIIKKIGAGTVALSTESGRIKISAGRSQFALPTLPAGDFPRISVPDHAQILEISPSALAEAIDRTSCAISTEETRYYLNGIFLHVDSVEGMFAVATDGHRLARTLVDTGQADIGALPDVIVPRKAVAEVKKILPNVDGSLQIQITSKQIAFVMDGVVFLSKVIDGTYPDYKRVIPSVTKISVSIPTKALKDAVDRVTTVSNEKTRAVTLDFEANGVTISSVSPEIGSATEEVECTSSGDIRIGFNSRYLLDALASLNSDVTTIGLSDPSSPALLSFEGAKGTDITLMPMRHS